MKAFLGLMKKEFLISRSIFLTWLVLCTLLIGFQVLMAIRYGNLMDIAPTFLLLFPFHLLFMPLLFWIMLRVEGTTQLWLFNPNSSFTLVSAKLLTVILLILFSLIFNILMGVMIFLFATDNGFLSYFLSIDTAKIIIIILLSGLYYSFWVLFLWTVYHSLAHVPVIKNFRGLIIAGILIGFNLFETYLFHHNEFVKNFVNNSPTIFGVNKPYESEPGLFIGYHFDAVPLVLLLYDGLLMALLFFISNRFLDKKVEAGNVKGI